MVKHCLKCNGRELIDDLFMCAVDDVEFDEYMNMNISLTKFEYFAEAEIINSENIRIYVYICKYCSTTQEIAKTIASHLYTILYKL